ncbi:MAG: lactate utilization protein C [Rhodocyclaceae bacterium]|nr:lactate utilization protein C [Rhodocyclaceae bacterium]
MSKEQILAEIRRRLRRPQESLQAAQAALEEALQQKVRGPMPALPPDAQGLRERFLAQAERHASCCERIASIEVAPWAVRRFLDARGLPRRAVIWPSLAELDWQGAGVEVAARAAQDADLVGITACFCAIAETGSLMLCSSPQTPATVSLLPPTHIALVPASRIVATMEDAWQLARAELGMLPRAVNFVSGPSRTGDIEQTIVLGAHGPAHVHLLLIESA